MASRNLGMPEMAMGVMGLAAGLDMLLIGLENSSTVWGGVRRGTPWACQRRRWGYVEGLLLGWVRTGSAGCGGTV